MLVTFKTNNYASITFFGDIALRFLRILGHSHSVPGAILAADVPEALRRLTATIETETLTESAPANNQDEDAGQVPVSIRSRALPLIELLTAAANADSDVIWE
ncbi:MAG: hypothetical protein ACJAWL_000144 [Motiliproteus sp.]|jgi:hypothetical protein